MAQIYQTNIETFEDLQYVVNAVSRFSFDRFIYVLLNRHIPVSEVSEMRARLLEVNAKLAAELSKLQEYSTTFNKEFVTTHNDYFSSAYHLLRKVKTGTIQLKRLFRQFTPHNAAAMRQVNPTNIKPAIWGRSSLGGAEYMPSLFSREHYSDDVNALYRTMAEFMETMYQCMGLCVEMLREENKIRLNKKTCQSLYRKSKEDQYLRIVKIIHSIHIDTAEFLGENNPAIKLRNSVSNEEDFAQKGFHNLTVEDVAALATKEIVQEAKRGEFTEEELILFNQDSISIKRARYIIQHFDEYLPENFTRKQIPSTYVACMLWWCKIPLKKNLAFVKYFAQTYKSAHGAHKPPSNPAVNQAKREDWKKKKEFNLLISKWENVEIA